MTLRGRTSLFGTNLAFEQTTVDRIKVRTQNYDMHCPARHGQADLEDFQVIESYLNWVDGRWRGPVWVAWRHRGSSELRNGPVHDLVLDAATAWERKRKARLTIAKEFLTVQEQSLEVLHRRLADCEQATPQAIAVAEKAAEEAEPRIVEIQALIEQLSAELLQLQGREAELSRLRHSSGLVDYFRTNVENAQNRVKQAKAVLEQVQGEYGVAAAPVVSAAPVVAGIGLALLD